MSTRAIQVRPSRNPRWQKQGGWEVFEAEGVTPVYCGDRGRESALSYARQRAGYGRAEIQVLDATGTITATVFTDNDPNATSGEGQAAGAVVQFTTRTVPDSGGTLAMLATASILLIAVRMSAESSDSA